MSDKGKSLQGKSISKDNAKHNARVRKSVRSLKGKLNAKDNIGAKLSIKSTKPTNNPITVSIKHNASNKSTYKVSDQSAVWLCPNAKLKDHECNYALCDLCYLKLAPPGRPGRKRGILSQKTSSSEGLKCNHNIVITLEQFFDHQYFTTNWKIKMIQEGGIFPHQCVDCGKEFSA